MKKWRISLTWAPRFLVGLVAVAASFYAWPILANPHQDLNRLVLQLRSAPTDPTDPSEAALRKKIIAIAVTLNPPPAIPRAARDSAIRAGVHFTDARYHGADVDTAIKLYERALMDAPWW